MRKLVILLLCILSCSISANAQTTRLQAREAEWKSYPLPQTNFARHLDTEKRVVFRVPADWKHEGTDLIFSGPHSSKIQLVFQSIPDGYPLHDFFASVVQLVKDSQGVAETIVIRQTQLQDLEAREMSFDVPDAEGEMTRSTSWLTVSGPLAVTLNFQAPIAHAAELEPFFKALVQSVMFVPHSYPEFEKLRSSTIKTPAPGPIHEIDAIATSLNGINSDRQSVVTRLSVLFSSHTDMAIDLLLDRRPLIRGGAVEALARSNNDSLQAFLWEMLDDREPFVAEAAARALANTPDVINKTITHSLSGLRTQTFGRLWPFLSREKRNELLELLFSRTAVDRRPPPPVATNPPARGKVSVTVIATEPEKPAGQISAVAVKAGISDSPHVQMGGLMLLRDLTPEEFKLPLARIMASNHDPLIALGLQVANDRREPLPLDTLFKLTGSQNTKVKKLAIQSLGISASVSDIPRIEALISKDGAYNRKVWDDELRLSIKKIRFRHDFAAAKSIEQARDVVLKAMSDPSLADFAFTFDCEASVNGCAPSTQPSLKAGFKVKSFAENLLPKKVELYTAIPSPGETVEKFYETLEGVQLESPRAQSNMVLIMGFVRQQLARQLSAPADSGALIDYTGIDPDSPIALAAWTPVGPYHSKVRRRAIVLRVRDRTRFERSVERFQQTGDSFTDLTDALAGGSRAMVALPAVLPFGGQEALAGTFSKPRSSMNWGFSFIGEKEWNGLRIKTIERRQFDWEWLIEGSSTHLAYIGDTVVVAPDLATIRELLTDGAGRQYLAENSEFQKAIQRGGDVVYFSDLKSVLADTLGKSDRPIQKFNESGSLKFSGSSWENSHYLSFDESDWAKTFLPFDPGQLSAPRALLPASTIAYYFMNVDTGVTWPPEFQKLLTTTETESFLNLWALDFKREVLPELGPECGAAMLDLPNIHAFEKLTWAVFCKLKSNKLSEELKSGGLFRGVGPASDFAEVKVGKRSYFVASRNEFLIVSNQAKALAAFDGKTNLAATRDYSRAVEKVPAGLIAFGGYNLEAAIAAASGPPAEEDASRAADVFFSFARAFHSQKFYATAAPGTIEARSSVAMDREGRYPVADLAYLPRGTNITLATVEPSGVPVTDQNRLSTLVLKIRAKAPGPIDNIKDDLKTADQIVEQKAANELLVTVNARRAAAEKAVELPVKDPALAEYLKATPEFPANKEVIDQAREIAGNDKDAWSVARKLADWTYKNLEWKLVLRASADQTLATREADCSEFSQLYIAMARSLGLPARMISGLAYSGSSFGGHAWVEVWAGRWIELDPTWGTHFADATHIRSASNALLTSAALNWIEIEVVEAKRTVADFQKSPRALAEHLATVLPHGIKSEVEAAIDLPALTDEFIGDGAWTRLTDGEREQLWSAYRRIVSEIASGYKADGEIKRARLLHLHDDGKQAEAICLMPPDDLLLKLRFLRRNDVWYLAEILQADSGLAIVSETLRPVTDKIQKAAAGEKTPAGALSDFVRMLLLIESNPAKAVEMADAALKHDASNKPLRFLKASTLLITEGRENDGVTLLQELAAEGYAPAIFKLAERLSSSEDEKDSKQAIELYERYALLEPHDPRPLQALATAYDNIEECDKSEAAYRKAITIDPGNTNGYVNLVEFLVLHERVGEAGPVFAAAEKYREPDDDLFGWTVQRLYQYETHEHAEKLLASDPSKWKTSYLANFIQGRIHSNAKRYAAALKSFEVAAQLDHEASNPHVFMAYVHRQQFRWAAALKAAQRAIALDADNSEAHYQRACALARLGRTKEAITALEKAVELDPDQAEWIAEEKDLKGLRLLPAFKKLLPEPAMDNN